MKTVERYLANDWEDAVVKVMKNGNRYTRFFTNGENPELECERLAHPESKVAYGDYGNSLIEISEEDYNTFGKTWHFGSSMERVNL